VIDKPPAGAAFDVVFVGRANVDLTVRVPRRASAGRAAFGTPLAVTPGGKSLNQAIAAAAHGGRCCLIAQAGADAWGEQLSSALAGSGVDISHFRLIDGVVTGAAIVEVTPDGESYVTLAISPATELNAADIRRAFAALTAKVSVVQLDLPGAPVAELLSRRRSPIIVGNLIPHPDLDPAQLGRLDVLVVNQAEANAILRTVVDDPLEAATKLRSVGPRTVVVTAGPAGAAYSGRAGSGIVPAPSVPRGGHDRSRRRIPRRPDRSLGQRFPDSGRGRCRRRKWRASSATRRRARSSP
jgi:ribokinase